jgi:hypothetical protein
MDTWGWRVSSGLIVVQGAASGVYDEPAMVAILPAAVALYRTTFAQK